MKLTIEASPQNNAALVDWLIRYLAPVALIAAEFPHHAEALHDLPPVTPEHLERQGKLRAHTTATKAAAKAVETAYVDLITKHTIDGPGVSEALLGEAVISTANLARKLAYPSRAGWWAYYALCEAGDLVGGREQVAPTGMTDVLRSGVNEAYSIQVWNLFHTSEGAAFAENL